VKKVKIMNDNWPQGKAWADKWLHRYFRVMFRIVGLRYAGWTTRNGFVDIQGIFGADQRSV